MKLISCKECAVMLDARYVYFPSNIYNEDGSVDMERAEWNGEDYVAAIQCPICQSKIQEEECT